MLRAYYLLLGWSHSNIYWDLTTFASYVYLFRNSLLWTVPIHTDALWTLQCCLLRLAVLLYLKVTLYLFWFLGTFYCSVISIAFLLPVFLCWIDPPLFTTIFQVSRPQLRLWVPSTGSSLSLYSTCLEWTEPPHNASITGSMTVENCRGLNITVFLCLSLQVNRMFSNSSKDVEMSKTKDE